ncbi:MULTISPECIES: glycosyltransferase family 1 protein [unclassified Leucobacter]|uniref:rhamnosyltransferase WsaF family glycosyltransferase n=1 Tax=unclassified Leucobacter TaxID=2621730 RepID=UPI00165DFAD4|nr:MULTISPECIES: glycosyltransferase family 1 protein [unclassified Leucobacter]MBC9936591.1 glycosyltransferase family 1 protein [Leucobacter sp. cx-87]
MNKLKRGMYFLREEGPRRTLARVFTFLSNRLLSIGADGKMMVSPHQVLAADWTEPTERFTSQKEEGPFELAWIMSPPGWASGGHQNIFRFIHFAEQAGHRCRIYLYSTSNDVPSLEETKRMLEKSDAYPEISAPIEPYDETRGVAQSVDAIFATGWETAYPVFNDTHVAKRFYFVQDFEPSFYPVGTQTMLAENTYRFGFHGITAGGWLPGKLGEDFGMDCDHFDFAAEPDNYSVTNTAERDELFFYARPVTERRAFEFGLLVLQEFSRMRPDVTINFAGWDLSSFDIPFPHRSHGAMALSDLNGLYNRCRAGLVLSLTNMSLLPLELIAAGVVPVVNDGANNRLVSDHPGIEFVAPTPHAMARRLLEVFERAQDPVALAAGAPTHTWHDSGQQFLSALEKAMRVG